MIKSLTKEQEAKVKDYYEEYLKIGLSTEPCDRVKAEAALSEAHVMLGLPPNPTFIWADSPQAGQKIAAQLAAGRKDVTKEELEAQAGKASYGSFEAYWVAFYSFISEQLLDTPERKATVAKEIVMNCGVYWTFEDVIVVTEKPVHIHRKDKKLHAENGLALEYKDGTGIVALDGTRYSSLLEKEIALAASK